MRQTRPKLTVRRLMATVALAALGFSMTVRSRQYRIIARSHSVKSVRAFEQSLRTWNDEIAASDEYKDASVCSAEYERFVEKVTGGRNSAGFHLHRLWRYHDELDRKYSRAAIFPFLPIAPDPPEPKPSAK